MRPWCFEEKHREKYHIGSQKSEEHHHPVFPSVETEIGGNEHVADHKCDGWYVEKGGNADEGGGTAGFRGRDGEQAAPQHEGCKASDGYAAYNVFRSQGVGAGAGKSNVEQGREECVLGNKSNVGEQDVDT